MCGKGPRLEAPAANPTPPTRDEAGSTQEAEKERKRLRAAQAGGRSGTILTSYQGLGTRPDQEQKSLLGT